MQYGIIIKSSLQQAGFFSVTCVIGREHLHGIYMVPVIPAWCLSCCAPCWSCYVGPSQRFLLSCFHGHIEGRKVDIQWQAFSLYKIPSLVAS